MSRYHITEHPYDSRYEPQPPPIIYIDNPCTDDTCTREHVYVITEQEHDAFVDLAIDRGIDQLRG